ncbi:MAG: cls [Frondihabitans sp.]|nr:cls [Frondihabitans sp.]
MSFLPSSNILTPRPLAAIARKRGWLGIVFIIIEYVIKIAAIGFIPENRRTGSSFAWLMLVLFVPVVGLPLFLLFGSPYVQGRRHRIQGEANKLITDRTSKYPDAPAAVAEQPGLESIVGLNRALVGMPMVSGRNDGLYGEYEDTIRAMAAAVQVAEREVNVAIYIMAWDSTTDVFFTALADAVARGVTVRLLFDHIGTSGYPGYGKLKRRLTKAGIQWHPMMPIDPLRGRWRRPDLRNHRKLLVVDGSVGFMGSQNMIDSGYLKPKNTRVGRHWKDLNIKLSGPIVDSLSAVFAIDWFTETGERLEFEQHGPAEDDPKLEETESSFQLVPSGPGFPTQPNLRLFVSLIHRAQSRLSITSPYFVPDESLLTAITTAAYRGVDVELFVSEKADQFMVQHAQRSYYKTLLEAGVKIYQYPAPTVLHAKHLLVDGEVAVIGSSNMDNRSFALDYEIMLMSYGGTVADDLEAVIDGYRTVSTLLTAAEWRKLPWYLRYVDNVMRLTSDLQ